MRLQRQAFLLGVAAISRVVRGFGRLSERSQKLLPLPAGWHAVDQHGRPSLQFHTAETPGDEAVRRSPAGALVLVRPVDAASHGPLQQAHGFRIVAVKGDPETEGPGGASVPADRALAGDEPEAEAQV